MATDHTTKERDAINRAFNAMTYAAETTDWSMARRLREALKHERKERSSITTAKACLVESFLTGFNDPSHPAKDVCIRQRQSDRCGA